MSEFTKYENGQTIVLSQEEIDAIESERLTTLTETNERSNRMQRNKLLADTDWIITKATETATEVPADVITYRQALRDITSNVNWPNLVEADWPTKP